MNKPLRNSLLAIIIPAVFLRLVFSALYFHPDIKSHHFHAQFLSRGVIDIYKYVLQNRDSLPYTDTFNYPPLTYYFLGSWNFIAGKILGPDFYTWLNDWGPNGYTHPRMFQFMLVLKFPYLLFDLLIGILLYKYYYQLKAKSYKLLVLWFFNPLSLYAVYMLGQFDIICAALTVAALLLVQKQRLGLAALMLGLGAALKTYPLLLLPFVLIRSSTIKQFINVAILGILIFLLPLLPVINSPAFRSSMTNSNLTQYIFYAGLPVSATQSIPYFVLIWGIVFWFSWSRRKNLDLIPEFLTLTLTVTLIAHFHAQWIVWSLPFLVRLIAGNNRFWPVAAALALGYFGTVFLVPDQYVFLGLFSAINPHVLSFPPLSQILKPVIDPAFLQSVFHTILTASGIYLIIKSWKLYEKS